MRRNTRRTIANGDDPNLAPLLNVTHCPIKRFGLGEENAVRAFNMNYGYTNSAIGNELSPNGPGKSRLGSGGPNESTKEKKIFGDKTPAY